MIKRGLFILILMSVFPLVSAEIAISQLNNVYSLGDNLNVQIDLLASQETNGFLIGKLVCPNGEVELYRSSYNLEQGQSIVAPLSILLTKSLIGNSSGICQIIVSYGTEVVSSQNFEISNNIEIQTILASANYLPGQNVQIEGSALKGNGEFVEGFVELRLSNNGSIVSVVNGGEFTLNFTLPENAFPGDQDVMIRVYDRDSQGEINNEGFLSKTINVKQIVKSAEVIVSSESVSPESEFYYETVIYDQTGSRFDGPMEITVYLPNGNIFFKKNTLSGSRENLEISSGSPYGYWKIEMVSQDLKATKLFYVEEYEKAEFVITNKSLIIINKGNIPYVKDVEVKIGEYFKVVSANIKVGQSKEYKLSAPENFYDIFINDGLNNIQGHVFLTGRVIDVSEAGGVLDFKIILFIVLLVVVTFGVYTIGKRKTNLLSKISFPIKRNTKSVSVGGKRESAVSLAVRHNSPGTNEANEAIERMIDYAVQNNAKFQKEGNHSIFTLTPTLTRKSSNGENSIILASKIAEILTDHNKRYKNKIDFGIGINEGEAILENRSGEIGVTNVGNLVSGAKKIATLSNGDVLLSNDLHRKVINTIKTEKVSEDAWRVVKITDRSKVDMDRLLKRS